MSSADQPHLLLLTAGDFGQEVAQRLAAQHRVTRMDVGGGTHPSLWPHADVLVLATGGERTRIADAVDRTAFLRRVPWFAVLARAAHLQCGPVVVPGSTACYACFLKRRSQHRRSLLDGDGDGAAPQGFARHHVAIAVGLAEQALRDALAVPQEPTFAAVRSYDVLSGTTSRADVVAVDGCVRCRGRKESLELRSRELWSELDAAAHPHPAPPPQAPSPARVVVQSR